MKLTKAHSCLFAGGLSLVLLPAAFAGGGDKKFSKMDTNGDGQISRAEHNTGAKRMFVEMDASGDGVVTSTEMERLAAIKGDRGAARDEMSANDKLRMVDQNSDGRLSATEHAAHAEKMFAKMDTDGNGSLSQQEMEAGHKAKKKHKRDS